MSTAATNYKVLAIFSAALTAAVALGGCAAPAEEAADADSASSDFTTSQGTWCLFGAGLVVGAIEDKYLSLGGCLSFLGPPLSNELRTPDGVGRYTSFANGSIYWRADIGAHVVRGEIRELWRAFGWEGGDLGYPISDETLTPDGRGRFNVFEGGSVYWTMQTGAHEVRGAIRDKWGALGFENGLGYPVAGERAVPEGIRSDFERGSITWVRENGRLNVERW